MRKAIFAFPQKTFALGSQNKKSGKSGGTDMSQDSGKCSVQQYKRRQQIVEAKQCRTVRAGKNDLLLFFLHEGNPN